MKQKLSQKQLKKIKDKRSEKVFKKKIIEKCTK